MRSENMQTPYRKTSVLTANKYVKICRIIFKNLIKILMSKHQKRVGQISPLLAFFFFFFSGNLKRKFHCYENPFRSVGSERL